MSLEALIETAWSEHGDQPQAVAEKLAAARLEVKLPVQVAPYARIVTHVFGEHLGQWHQGIALLQSLRLVPGVADDAATIGAIARSVATLRHAGDTGEALEELSLEDRVAVLAASSSALAARGEHGRAVAAYGAALEFAAPGLPAGSPALRALAVGGNNLAAALEEKKERTDAESAGMVAAAEGGLKYWTLAGTWLEEERAEYRLTRSLLCAGRAKEAVEHAEKCVEICERNRAPAFEKFFGAAALALALRAAGDAPGFTHAREAALAQHAQVPAEEKEWCAGDLQALEG